MVAEPSSLLRDRSAEARGDGFASLIQGWLSGSNATTPVLMGIVNVTPDSFSDGGLFASAGKAIAQGRKLVTDGAAILDVGGESTRRGATPVGESEETARILPVIDALRGAGALISVDTMKSRTAAAALSAGAHIVNDIRGLQGDPKMAEVVAKWGAGVVAMHNPGLLGSADPLPGDPVRHCLGYFERSLEIAREAGIPEDRIALDPGFGFGKSPEQNLQLLARLPELTVLGFPLAVGTSRKAFIGKVTGRELPGRLIGTVATNVAAALAGAAIIRVHDVAEHVDAMLIAAAIRAAGQNAGTSA